LQRHAALDQPRQIHVAGAAAPEQVAIPEKRVGMQIGDQQTPVQLPRGGVYPGQSSTMTAVEQPRAGDSYQLVKRAQARPLAFLHLDAAYVTRSRAWPVLR
jgi:hypothetical protein